jgi:hypothetical protein
MGNGHEGQAASDKSFANHLLAIISSGQDGRQ